MFELKVDELNSDPLPTSHILQARAFEMKVFRFQMYSSHANYLLFREAIKRSISEADCYKLGTIILSS